MISVHSRPDSLLDFLKRLRDDSTEAVEKAALHAWGTTAVKFFLNEDDIPQFAEEAAYLSEVLSSDAWVRLFQNLVNATINGNSNGKYLDPVLLHSLAYMIRKNGEQHLSQSTDILFRLFSHMKSQLEQEYRLGIDDKLGDKLYELVYALQLVVDAMNDVGVSNISHEELRMPLTNILKKLSEKPEVHLAQAASYTAQALRTIKDDDTRSKAARRGLLCLIDLTAKTLGAVANKDLNAMWEAAKAGYDSLERLKGFTLDMYKRQEGKTWYTALRATSMLIQAELWDELYSFIQQAECQREEDFLCGLCAQLDIANQADPGGKIKAIYQVILSCSDNEPTIRFWVEHSFPELKIHPAHKMIGKLKKTKIYEWKPKACGLERTGKGPSHESIEFLDKAYAQCMSAKEYYTKNALMNFYTQRDSERLQIQRLSGKQLPMKCCYINLTVVDDSHGGEISLPGLFNSRTSNGKTIYPKKIFIEGQAGVGKTTLCKKIVYDFVYQKLWFDRFDWILWLPLRQLKGKNVNSYSLKDLFHHEYFSQETDSELLAETLESIVKKTSDKVLFLLDGLDEISQDWNPETPMDRFLQTLLRQPQTIISSRPYSMKQLDKISQDLMLRTVGFDEEQIEKYVRAKEIQPDLQIANAICDFIEENSRIQEIARIPIQLDALCYTWKKLSGSSYNVKTTTSIYQAMCVELLRKDLLRSEKKINDKNITESMAEDLSESEVQEHMPKELNVLEGLAFHGLYNHVIEFDTQARIRIRQHLKNQGVDVPESLDRIIKYTSFLRSSSLGDDTAQQTFHFLHLTVQEFFAARYFAKHLSNQRNLHMLEVGIKQGNPGISPQEFIAREKYNVRYKVFWGFVAGYLSVELNINNEAEQGLIHFFETMEQESRDLLGATHQKLTMRCLREVALPDTSARLASWRKRLHRQLAWWGIFETRSLNLITLKRNYDYPEEVLYSLLREQPADTHVKKDTMKAISSRLKASTNITDLIALWMKQDPDGELKKLCLAVLANNSGLLSTSTQKALNLEMRRTLATPDNSFPNLNLHGRTLKRVIKLLGHKNLDKRKNALGLLAKQPTSTLQRFVKNIARGLSDPNPELRSRTADVLANLILPLEIIKSVIHLIVSDGSTLTYRVDQNLCRQSSVPEEILKYMISLLDHESRAVRRVAEAALKTQPELPSSVIESLIQKLGYIDDTLARIMWAAIWKQPLASTDFLKAVAAQLKSPEAAVQRQAAMVLGCRSDLPEATINCIADLLCATEASVREYAAVALSNQSRLPPNILKLLAAQLPNHDKTNDVWVDDGAIKAKCQAIEAFLKHADIETEYFNDLVALLKHENDQARAAVARSLEQYQELPCKVLEYLFHELENERAGDYEEVKRILSRVLPPKMVDGLLGLLEKLEWSDKRSTIIISIINHQRPLSPGRLRRIYKMLHRAYKIMAEEPQLHDINFYQWRILNLLSRQAKLPKDILLSLIREQRNTNDKEWASDIEDIISSQKPLPRDTFIALVKEEDSESFIDKIIDPMPPDIPPEILEIVAPFLFGGEDAAVTNRRIRDLATREPFYQTLPRMRMQNILRTYEEFLRFSFDPRYNFDFYFYNQCLVINVDEFHCEIPMSLYHRAKLQLIFRLFLLMLVWTSEIENCINGWAEWMRSHKTLLLSLVPIVLAVTVMWIVVG